MWRQRCKQRQVFDTTFRSSNTATAANGQSAPMQSLRPHRLSASSPNERGRGGGGISKPFAARGPSYRVADRSVALWERLTCGPDKRKNNNNKYWRSANQAQSSPRTICSPAVGYFNPSIDAERGDRYTTFWGSPPSRAVDRFGGHKKCAQAHTHALRPRRAQDWSPKRVRAGRETRHFCNTPAAERGVKRGTSITPRLRSAAAARWFRVVLLDFRWNNSGRGGALWHSFETKPIQLIVGCLGTWDDAILAAGSTRGGTSS